MEPTEDYKNYYTPRRSRAGWREGDAIPKGWGRRRTGGGPGPGWGRRGAGRTEFMVVLLELELELVLLEDRLSS